MAISDYGGFQRGAPYLTIDPETGEQVYHEGDMIEVSPTTRHQRSPTSALLRESAPYAAAIVAPHLINAMRGGDKVLQVTSQGSNAGYMTPGVTDTISTNAMRGTSMLPQASATGSAATSGTLAALGSGAPAAAAVPSMLPGSQVPTNLNPSNGIMPGEHDWMNLPGGVRPPKGAMDWIELGLDYGLPIVQGLRSRSAVNNAAEAQQQGIQRAMDVNDRIYAPYLNMGGQAANTLAGLSGFLPVPATGGNQQAQSAVAGQQTPRSSQGQQVIGHAQPRISSEQAPPNSLAALAAPLAAQQQTQSGYVRMRSPDGEERSVPQSMVQQMRQAGGTVVA